MLARVENGRAKTLAENSPVNIAALVDFIEYTLDDIKGKGSLHLSRATTKARPAVHADHLEGGRVCCGTSLRFSS